MNTKWIRHPNLPDGQEVEVPAQSVSHYAHSGWIVMDEPPAWSTVRPEDATLAEMTVPTADAPGVRDADEASDSESAPGNDESGDETADQEDEKPTGSKRSRRAPTKEG